MSILPKAYIIAVDLGYGHQRAANSLTFLSFDGKMILANNYDDIPESDKQIWEQGRKPYEFISRFKHVPVVGDMFFWGMDLMQRIQPFYPRRSLLKPNLQLRTNLLMIRKKKWGKHLIDKLNKKPLPLVTTFFTIAYMAEEFNYEADIYLVVCDADVSRAWAPLNPVKSRIIYLAPTQRVQERLQLYGVPKDQIYLTGFPLPQENTGDEKLGVLKKDLGGRLRNLDPQERYLSKYKKTVIEHLGLGKIPARPDHPLTLTFAVGGAGAQRELGAAIISSLKKKIIRNQIVVNLIAGIKPDVHDYFKGQVEKLGLDKEVGEGVHICFEKDREKYFNQFNKILRQTDILWTKPSELCFYAALGIPIVIAPPIGSQEKFNRHWLRTIGAGINQENPKHTNEWLFDSINSGWLAEAAMQGFFEAPKYGTFNIQKVISGQAKLIHKPDMILQY